MSYTPRMPYNAMRLSYSSVHAIVINRIIASKYKDKNIKKKYLQSIFSKETEGKALESKKMSFR